MAKRKTPELKLQPEESIVLSQDFNLFYEPQTRPLPAGVEQFAKGLQSFVGAISDGERAFIESISPGLSLTRDGNLLLLALQKRGANRNLDIEGLRDTFYDQVGSLSGKNKDGKTFNQVLGDFYEENPFMDDDFRTELKEISSRGLNAELLTDGGQCVNGEILMRIGKGETSQIIKTGKSC